MAVQRSFDNLTHGTVSQRIKALEESLSIILVKRERPVAVTHGGEVPTHRAP